MTLSLESNCESVKIHLGSERKFKESQNATRVPKSLLFLIKTQLLTCDLKRHVGWKDEQFFGEDEHESWETIKEGWIVGMKPWKWMVH